MTRWRIVLEGAAVYSAAMTAVWVWWAGVVVPAQASAWLIPLTWIVAAALATLPMVTTSRDLFCWAQWIGEPRVTVRSLLFVSLIVLPVFGLVYLLYHSWWRDAVIVPLLPARWGPMALYQLVSAGFPEELFFRGYLQQRFDDAFGRPWRLFGASYGPGLLLANLLFAAGHFVVTGDVQRLAVFFPGLLFGWLLARTGALLDPALFHGLCNITLLTLHSWIVR
ncbi:MAG TPA: CPBP family intramembrane glutamic endopeptidase [Nitrospiria bacterium]|nr:CPBP family intramembrane glutamic endopeptidase [Nitrospiria bacterium]